MLPPDFADLEARLAVLEKSLQALDSQVDAAEQSLAALQMARQNEVRVNDLDDRLQVLVRGMNAIACVLVGASLLWFGSPMTVDALDTNDRVADWLIMGGGGCIAYGLLVLTSHDARVMNWLEQMNPWRR